MVNELLTFRKKILKDYQLEIKTIFEMLDELANLKKYGIKEGQTSGEKVLGEYFYRKGEIILKPNTPKGVLYHELIHLSEDILFFFKNKEQELNKLYEKRQQILDKVNVVFSTNLRDLYWRNKNEEFFAYFITYLHNLWENEYYIIGWRFVIQFFQTLRKHKLMLKTLDYIYCLLNKAFIYSGIYV